MPDQTPAVNDAALTEEQVDGLTHENRLAEAGADNATWSPERAAKFDADMADAKRRADEKRKSDDAVVEEDDKLSEHEQRKVDAAQAEIERKAIIDHKRDAATAARLSEPPVDAADRERRERMAFDQGRSTPEQAAAIAGAAGANVAGVDERGRVAAGASQDGQRADDRATAMRSGLEAQGHAVGDRIPLAGDPFLSGLRHCAVDRQGRLWALEYGEDGQSLVFVGRIQT